MTSDGNLAFLRCYPRMKSFMSCILVCMMMKMCSGLCKHTTRLKSTFLCLPQNTRKYMYFYIEIMACAFFFIIDSFFKMGTMDWTSKGYDGSGHSKSSDDSEDEHTRVNTGTLLPPLRCSMAQLLSKGQCEIAMGLLSFIQLSQKNKSKLGEQKGNVIIGQTEYRSRRFDYQNMRVYSLFNWLIQPRRACDWVRLSFSHCLSLFELNVHYWMGKHHVLVESWPQSLNCSSEEHNCLSCPTIY